MEEPSDLLFFGLKIQAPTAALTDLGIAAVCLHAFFQLKKMGDDQPLVAHFFRQYFGWLAAATTLGGLCGHAFLGEGPFVWMKIAGWLPGMVAVSWLARSAVEMGRGWLGAWLSSALSRLILIETAIAVGLLLSFFRFEAVRTHGVFCLVFLVLPIQMGLFFKRKTAGSGWFLVGIGSSAAASFVFTQKIGWSADFDFLPISHLFLSLAAWFFYRGAAAFLSK